jgi:uncharacterized membrane protein YoaK (UPF0700 family)
MAPIDQPKTRFDFADCGLALLAFAAGSMDVLAFLNLRGVFPSAMTGNTALLGLALGQGHLIAATRPLVAFVGFVAGTAAASASVDLWLSKLPKARAVSRLLAIEATLLGAFALASQFIDWPIGGGAPLYGLIAVAAVSMGLQSAVARLIGRSGITTIVFTSTLTAIVSSMTEALLHPARGIPLATKRQLAAYSSYAIGATISGVFAGHAAAIAALPAVALIAAAVSHRLAGQKNAHA